MEAALARNAELEVCTDYANGGAVMVEPLLNTAIAFRKRIGECVWLLSRDVTLRLLYRYRRARENDRCHGSSRGDD